MPFQRHPNGLATLAVVFLGVVVVSGRSHAGQAATSSVRVTNPTKSHLVNWPVEVGIHVSGDVAPKSIAVTEGDRRLLCQVESRYDDPSTPAKEIEIIWQTDLKPGEKKAFTIHCGAQQGKTPVAPASQPPDQNLKARGEETTDIVTNQPALLPLAMENSLLAIQLRGPIEWKSPSGTLTILDALPRMDPLGNEYSEWTVIENGPIRLRARREGKGGPLEERDDLSVYANRPEIHRRIRWTNASAEDLTTPSEPADVWTYQFTARPGGAMTTYDEPRGEDFFAVGAPADAPVIRKFWGIKEHTFCCGYSADERWCDFYDAVGSPSGVGFICIEPEGAAAIYNHNDWSIPERRNGSFRPEWRSLLRLVPLINRKLAPGEHLDLNLYIYPHAGDWRETQLFWQAKQDVQVSVGP